MYPPRRSVPLLLQTHQCRSDNSDAAELALAVVTDDAADTSVLTTVSLTKDPASNAEAKTGTVPSPREEQ